MGRAHDGKRAAAAARKRLRRAEARAGIDRQVEEVRAACASEDFQRRFSARAARAGAAVTSMAAVQAMAHAALDEMGVAHQGVMLTFSWDPRERALGIFFRPKQKIGHMVRHALQSVAARP